MEAKEDNYPMVAKALETAKVAAAAEALVWAAQYAIEISDKLKGADENYAAVLFNNFAGKLNREAKRLADIATAEALSMRDNGAKP